MNIYGPVRLSCLLYNLFFTKHFELLKYIIEQNSTNFTYCHVFLWLRQNPLTIKNNPHLLMLFLNLVPNELVVVFTAASIPKKLYKWLIVSFLFELYKDLYQEIWKIRSQKFKEWKIANNISKRTFTSFKRKRKQRDDIGSSTSRNTFSSHFVYSNPFNDHWRMLDETHVDLFYYF